MSRRVGFASVRREQIAQPLSGAAIRCERRGLLSGIRREQIGRTPLPSVTAIQCERRWGLSGIRRFQIGPSETPPIPVSGGTTPKIVNILWRDPIRRNPHTRRRRDEEDFLQLIDLIARALNEL